MRKRIKEPPPEFFRFQTFYNFTGEDEESCCVCERKIQKGIHDLGLNRIYCLEHADEDGRLISGICVDPLRNNFRDGRFRSSCHMFSDNDDTDELHEFAELIGLRRSYFQGEVKHSHYDLTDYMREKAVKNGAREVDRRYIIQLQKAVASE